MNILITGVAGFIGFHLTEKLLSDKRISKIIGIDNINNYYDINLKKERLRKIKNNKKFLFFKYDLKSIKLIDREIKKNKIEIIIHLAAQAGVRYSINNPKAYFDSNLQGFFNILELSRKNKIKHLLSASTSSVYGDCKKFPIKEDFNTDKPLSFYAATKKSNEVMAYSYANIYKLPISIMRFFTIYGPFGRPDMALFKITKNIINKETFDVFNYGKHERDFTYIDDCTQYIKKIINKPPKKLIPFEVYNIASNSPKKLNYFIKLIEKEAKNRLITNFLPKQMGDVEKTHASTAKINKIVGKPKIKDIAQGIKKFVRWYKSYYKI